MTLKRRLVILKKRPVMLTRRPVTLKRRRKGMVVTMHARDPLLSSMAASDQSSIKCGVGSPRKFAIFLALNAYFNVSRQKSAVF